MCDDSSNGVDDDYGDVVVLVVIMVMDGHTGNVCNIDGDVYGLGGDNDDSYFF